jgi:hypothetical protein
LPRHANVVIASRSGDARSAAAEEITPQGPAVGVASPGHLEDGGLVEAVEAF